MNLSEEQQRRILELKHEAVEHKKNGNIDKAKMIMGQIREIEFEGVEVGDCNDPLLLKQLALVFKSKGDIMNAKNALLKSKQLLDEQKRQQYQQEQEQQEQEQQAQQAQQAQPQQQQQQQQQQDKQDEEKDHEQSEEFEDEGEETVDDDALEESIGASGDTKNVTFTDEEMLDKETMCELKMAGINVPSEEQYQQKVLAYKQAAIKAKNNKDIQSAKSYLMQAKKFEYVNHELSKIKSGGMNDLFAQENSTDINAEEEAWLLKELAGESGGDNADFNLDTDDPAAMCFDDANLSGNDFELDDLDDLDAEMLKAMIDSGMMNVPHPEEIFELAKEKKINAANLMKEKNVDAAKAYLAESKRLTKRAQQLQDMLQQIEEIEGHSSKATDLSALEKMLDGNNNNNSTVKKKKKVSEEQESSNSNKNRDDKQSKDTRTSEDIKKEVFRLKNENKIKEATMMLRLYKAKLAEENHMKDIQQRKDIIKEILEVELPIAKEQIRLFQFYERFVCSSSTAAAASTSSSEDGKPKNVIGSQHLKFWKRYHQECNSAIKNIQESIDKNSVNAKVEVIRGVGVGGDGSDDNKKDSSSENKTTTNSTGKIMTRIANFDDQLSFVGNNGNKIGDNNNTHQPLEVAILSVSNLTENKHFQKLLKDQKKQQLRLQKANAAIASANGKNSSSIKAAASEVLSSSPVSSCGRYPLLQGTIQVQVILQIPPNETNTDKNISLQFSSCSSLLHQANAEDDATIEGNYDDFGKSQYVKLSCLPKGINIHDRKQIRQHQKEKGPNSNYNIEYATIVHKRMERKKIQINVFYDPTPAQQKNDSDKKKSSSLLRGLFGGKKKKAPVSDDSSDEDADNKWKLLGKVIIELNHFLDNNFIAGDFPLSDTTKKELGGSIRLGMKMNHPYGVADNDENTAEGIEENDDNEEMENVLTGMANNIDMIPYNAMIFRPIILEQPPK